VVGKWLAVGGSWWVVRGSRFGLLITYTYYDHPPLTVFGLQRRNQAVKHSPDAIDSLLDHVALLACAERQSHRQFELNVNLSLRSQGDVEMIKKCLPALSACAFADV